MPTVPLTVGVLVIVKVGVNPATRGVPLLVCDLSLGATVTVMLLVPVTVCVPVIVWDGVGVNVRVGVGVGSCLEITTSTISGRMDTASSPSGTSVVSSTRCVPIPLSTSSTYTYTSWSASEFKRANGPLSVTAI